MYRREFLNLGLAFPLVSFYSRNPIVTTWADEEFICPVCTTKNIFRVVMSYGSYIYNWPSKYQLIYWPVIDSNSVYCCKKCHLSTFMWDYKDLDKNKIPKVTELLKNVTLKETFKDYAQIPMSQRLDIAEKVYLVLEKDDEFWCWFYRIKGYHYADEKNGAKADESRKKALEIAQRMLSEKKFAVAEKELLVVSGAMKHFLKEDEGAIKDLNTALKTKFQLKELDEEKNKNGENNLNALANEYIEKIKSPKPPRDSEQ